MKWIDWYSGNGDKLVSEDNKTIARIGCVNVSDPNSEYNIQIYYSEVEIKRGTLDEMKFYVQETLRTYLEQQLSALNKLEAIDK